VQEREDAFHYRGDTLTLVEHSANVDPIVVSIRGAGHRRIESHFERLIARENVERIEAEERNIASTLQREKAAMQKEDALAQQCRSEEESVRARESLAAIVAEASAERERCRLDDLREDACLLAREAESECSEIRLECKRHRDA